MIIDGKTDYGLIKQSELVERLHQKGIRVTSQTLRNWEKNELMIPPVRKGNNVSGRSAVYYDYVLAECYAVYNLSRGFEFSPNYPPMPKFSMDNMRIGRNGFLCDYGGVLPHYPEAPVNVSPIRKGFARKSKEDMMELIDKIDLDDFWDNQSVHIEKEYKSFLVQGWKIALSKGCDKFLKKYKR